MPKKSNPHAVLEEFIHDRMDLWQERLGLDHWTIDTRCNAGFMAEDGQGSMRCTAETEGRWQYMQAVVTFYMDAAARHSWEEIDRICCHEMVHVLLMPEQSAFFEKSVDDADGAYDKDADQMLAMRAERLELSTEMATRALLRAWGVWSEA